MNLKNNAIQAIVDTPLTKLRITCDSQQLLRIEFVDRKLKVSTSVPDLIKKTLLQIEAFYLDPNHHFTLPMDEAKTPFQHKVRLALLKIAAGSTLTYQELARQLNTSPRAIGNACRANPFPLIVPCHRIVATNNLGGFSGQTSGQWVELKAKLLALESA